MYTWCYSDWAARKWEGIVNVYVLRLHGMLYTGQANMVRA